MAVRRYQVVLLLWFFLHACQAPKDCQPLKVKVKPGDDATLPCRGREGAAISFFEWTMDQSHVLFCRAEGCVESFQDLGYRGRAQAVDPKMEHGEASMVLRNVTFEDAGRFMCKVLEATEGRGKRDITIRSVIDLKIQDSGPEPPEDGGAGLIAGLVAAGATAVVVFGVAAVVYFVRHRNPNNNGQQRSAPI